MTAGRTSTRMSIQATIILTDLPANFVLDIMILKWYHYNMKLLTRNTDYAVRATCCMASKPGRTVTVTELTDELKMPRPFLRKILQRLNKVGMVKSAKGKAGGFRLAKNPYKLILADFIEAFQGPFSINECVFKKKVCPNTNRCSLKRKIDEIEDYIEARLRSVSIGSILNKEA